MPSVRTTTIGSRVCSAAVPGIRTRAVHGPPAPVEGERDPLAPSRPVVSGVSEAEVAVGSRDGDERGVDLGAGGQGEQRVRLTPATTSSSGRRRLAGRVDPGHAVGHRGRLAARAEPDEQNGAAAGQRRAAGMETGRSTAAITARCAARCPPRRPPPRPSPAKIHNIDPVAAVYISRPIHRRSAAPRFRGAAGVRNPTVCARLSTSTTTRRRPVDERVLDAMLPFFREHFGNASSEHALGWTADEAVKQARERTARVIGATPRTMVFTSGATESISLAIRGAGDIYGGRRHRIVTVRTEHRAVLATCEAMEREGYEVDLSVGRRERPDRPRRAGGRPLRGDVPGERDVGQQRDRRDPADPRDRRDRSPGGRADDERRDPGRRQGADLGQPRRRRPAGAVGPQDVRAQGRRRALRPPARPARPARAPGDRRRAGAGAPRRDAQRARHRRARDGVAHRAPPARPTTPSGWRCCATASRPPSATPCRGRSSTRPGPRACPTRRSLQFEGARAAQLLPVLHDVAASAGSACHSTTRRAEPRVEWPWAGRRSRPARRSASASAVRPPRPRSTLPSSTSPRPSTPSAAALPRKEGRRRGSLTPGLPVVPRSLRPHGDRPLPTADRQPRRRERDRDARPGRARAGRSRSPSTSPRICTAGSSCASASSGRPSRRLDWSPFARRRRRRVLLGRRARPDVGLHAGRRATGRGRRLGRRRDTRRGPPGRTGRRARRGGLGAVPRRAGRAEGVRQRPGPARRVRPGDAPAPGRSPARSCTASRARRCRSGAGRRRGPWSVGPRRLRGRP